MIHTVATPKCHNAVIIFKALRRSAVKDFTSVYQASPRPFSLTTKSPYSFLECWCPQKPVRVWGHHTLLYDLTLFLRSQCYWDAAGTGSSPTCLISHIKLVGAGPKPDLLTQSNGEALRQPHGSWRATFPKCHRELYPGPVEGCQVCQEFKAQSEEPWAAQIPWAIGVKSQGSEGISRSIMPDSLWPQGL